LERRRRRQYTRGRKRWRGEGGGVVEREEGRF